jgi:hypothetical protein
MSFDRYFECGRVSADAECEIGPEAVHVRGGWPRAIQLDTLRDLSGAMHSRLGPDSLCMRARPVTRDMSLPQADDGCQIDPGAILESVHID